MTVCMICKAEMPERKVVCEIFNQIGPYAVILCCYIKPDIM